MSLTLFPPHAPHRMIGERISEFDVRALVEAKITEAGGVRALARKLKVSPAHVSDVRHGRRDFGKKILRKHFGIVKYVDRVVVYGRVQP